jgi:ATP-dependent RNA circularization protein (DNA/RNA ligase family)
MEHAIKYPKTFHLPFSEGLQNDDRRMEDETCFDGKDVAVTVKMDGENTSMYTDGIHARSLYAMAHNSQHYIKAFHGQIAHTIDKGWRICGENMYARHSIEYDGLESFFYVFSVWNDKNECLNLEATRKFCADRGLVHVRVECIIADFNYERDNKTLENIYRQVVARGDEGIVIRNTASYAFEDFRQNVAKAVRKNHVQTDVHWTKTWVPNKLEDEKLN